MHYQLNVEVTEEEIERVVKHMKNGKASGVDEVIAEVLKHGDDGSFVCLVLSIYCWEVNLLVIF